MLAKPFSLSFKFKIWGMDSLYNIFLKYIIYRVLILILNDKAAGAPGFDVTRIGDQRQV